jgi:uncharacterized membrane protein YcaP (DUF421 family)
MPARAVNGTAAFFPTLGGRIRPRDLSEHDVLEDLRLHGNVPTVTDVALAVFERNGHISVVKKPGIG